jgi:hypothetical protein
VPAERLLDARHGVAITIEGHGYDTECGELWFAGETAEALLLEMDARRRSLADEADELDGRAAAAAAAADEAARAAVEAETAYGAVAHLRERVLDPALLGVLAEVAQATDDGLRRAGEAALRLEEPLAARLTLGTQQAGELGSELRRLSALEGEAARETAAAAARAQAAEVVVARLGGSVRARGRRDRARHGSGRMPAPRSTPRAAAAGPRRRPTARARPMRRCSVGTRRSPLDADMLSAWRRRSPAPVRLERAQTDRKPAQAPVQARVDAGAGRSGTTRRGAPPAPRRRGRRAPQGRPRRRVTLNQVDSPGWKPRPTRRGGASRRPGPREWQRATPRRRTAPSSPPAPSGSTRAARRSAR